MLLGHIAVSGGRMASSLFALQHGAGEPAVGVIVGLYSVLPVLFGLHFGHWCDRYGSRRVVRGGLLLILLGILLPAAWPALPAIYFGALSAGAGMTLVAVSIQHAAGAIPLASGHARVGVFGWLTLGHSASSVLGPMIAGLLVDGLGFRAAFGVLSMATFAALLTTRRMPRALRASAEPAAPAARAGWRGLLAEPDLRRIYWVTTANAIAWDAFSFLGPVLGHRAQMSATGIGTMMACFAVGTFAIRLAVSSLGHRFSEWQMLGLALALVSVVWLLFPFAPAGPALFVLPFLLGCGVGCGQPNVLSLLHRHAPPGRSGEAIGLRSFFGNASGLAVPLVFGASTAVAGVWPICWLIAAGAGSAAALARGMKTDAPAKTGSDGRVGG